MARDDMEVIEYKILKYLYESIKAGHKTTLKDVSWNCSLFDITREYWLVIMRDLIDSGYVSGLKYINAKDMESVSEVGTFAITRVGREYLIENSVMQKAKKIAGKAFEMALRALLGIF